MSAVPAPLPKRRLVLQAAVAANGTIGAAGGLPWDIPADYESFLASTAGGVVVVGRKSLWDGACSDGRRAIVLSRDAAYAPAAGAAVAVARTFAEALAIADALPGGDGVLHVCGGAGVYAEALAQADRGVTLRLTEVHADFDGDRAFPDWRAAGAWEERSRSRGRHGDLEFSFVVLERVGGGAK
jgi:dihydrofolate reductase